MGETANYQLHLTEDSSESFKDWREKMNGTDDSNMMKIDAALGEKANSSVVVHTTLLATGWVGSEAPYTQDLLIEGLTATQNGAINIAHSASADQRDMVRNAMLFVVGQTDGKLTVAADGTVPTVDIPVYIILLD